MEFGRSLFSPTFRTLSYSIFLNNGHHQWRDFLQREFTDAGARSCWLSSCYHERGLGELHCTKDTNASEAPPQLVTVILFNLLRPKNKVRIIAG